MIDIHIEMANGLDVFLCSGASFGFERVHTDVDVARFFFILEVHPFLESQLHDSCRGRDTLSAAACWPRRSRGSKAWFAKRGRTCEFGLRRRDDEASVSLSALVASCGVSAAVRGRNAVDLRRGRGCVERGVTLLRRQCLSRPAVGTSLRTVDMGGR